MPNTRILTCVIALSFAAVVSFWTGVSARQATDIVIRPAATAVVHGGWSVVADSSAAGGSAVRDADAGAAKRTAPLAAPSDYFDVSFTVAAGVPYRLWLRGRAQNNSPYNDSVFVQFSGSLDAATGAAAYRIGTTSATVVNLEDCSGCGLSGWGWQDNGWGAGVLGPEVEFASSGQQTLRIQTREDGLSIDQIVLSPSTYRYSSPGALKNDTTILTATSQTSVTLVRGPYLQRVGPTAATVVWATRQSGTGLVRYSGGGTSAQKTATSRRVTATMSGLGYDYYQYEARLTGLLPRTAYAYDPIVAGVDLTSGSATFRTAPAAGTGSVTFVAFGDSGTGSTQQKQIAGLIAADTFDLAIHTGDVAYGTSSGTGDATYKTYGDWFFAIYKSWLPTHGFFPSEGNHDSRASNGNGAAYRDLFVLPPNGATAAYPDHAERYYSYDYGPVHFIALDTEFAFQDTTRRAEQLAWLEDDVARTSQPWKIAYFHRSPYASGGEHGSDQAVRSAFAPIFQQYGVQLALSAHEHIYERSRPWPTTSASPVTYIVTGGGGGPLYPAGTSSWTAYSASRHHYVRVTADGCTLFVRAVGLDGSVFDSATLTRCGAP